MTPESQRNLRDLFNMCVKSDIKDWEMTAETTVGKNAVSRDFEHRATRDKLTVTETTKYCPIDEMDVTTLKASGIYKGKDVKATLLIKPEID